MFLAISSRESELDGFLKQCKTATSPETASYLYKLGAVLVCGYIERSVEIVVIERLNNRGQPRVISFIKSHFQRGTNYNCSAISQLLVRFDEAWYRRFNDFMEDNASVKEGVSSCYAVRNSIAHGGTNSVSMLSLQSYFDAGKSVIAALVEATS